MSGLSEGRHGFANRGHANQVLGSAFFEPTLQASPNTNNPPN